jgi:hypothetical protein
MRIAGLGEASHSHFGSVNHVAVKLLKENKLMMATQDEDESELLLGNK